MALLLGFFQEDESYAKDEVSASVTVASEDSIDVNVTFPEVSEEMLVWLLNMQMLV